MKLFVKVMFMGVVLCYEGVVVVVFILVYNKGGGEQVSGGCIGLFNFLYIYLIES